MLEETGGVDPYRQSVLAPSPAPVGAVLLYGWLSCYLVHGRGGQPAVARDVESGTSSQL